MTCVRERNDYLLLYLCPPGWDGLLQGEQGRRTHILIYEQFPSVVNAMKTNSGVKNA